MFRLPFLFIATGLFGFVLFQVFNLADMAGWIGEHPRSPEGWFRAHLLVLGWATMVAMGAVYQLIAVVIQSDIYSRKLGYVHYGLFAAGTAGLLGGFHQADFRLIAVFATIACLGIIIFAVNMAATFIHASKWNTITISAGCAVLYLLLTGLSGMAMGLNFRFGWWSGIHDQLFLAHIWLGAIGWFGMLIVGFSFKMLPMFYLSHGYPESLQKTIVLLWNMTVLVGASSFLFDWPDAAKWLTLLLFAAAVTAYNFHIRQIRKHKHKPNPGEGIKWSVMAAGLLMATSLLLLPITVLFPDLILQPKVASLLGWLYLWGFVAMTILAYLSKIVPFLWWTHKYGPLVGKKKIPTMAELLDERIVRIGMTFIAASLIVLLTGIGSGISPLLSLGGSVLSVSSLIYIGFIAKVFLR